MILRFLWILIALVYAQFAFAGNDRLTQNSAHNVLEVVLFSSKPGYTPHQVINRAKAITPILQSYPGFISREFAENTKSKNHWSDIVHWATQHDG